MSNIDSILNLVFHDDHIMQHESLFEYYQDRQLPRTNGYPLTREILYEHDGHSPNCLNENLVLAKQKDVDIYIGVVSSGGHSGVCIIFVLGIRVYCITYGVNMYTDKKTGTKMIAIRTPEECLASPSYSIILWERFTDIHWDNIMSVYNSLFYIKSFGSENLLLSNYFEYSMIPFMTGHNCHTFAVAQVGDINLKEHIATLAANFRKGCKRVVRTLFQQCTPAPNKSFVVCIEPVVDLIVLAVKSGIFKGKNSRDGYKEILQEVMMYTAQRVEEAKQNGTVTVTYDRTFSDENIRYIEEGLDELERKLSDHIVRDTDEAGVTTSANSSVFPFDTTVRYTAESDVTTSATSSVFPFDTTPVDMYDDPIVRYTAESDVTKSVNPSVFPFDTKYHISNSYDEIKAALQKTRKTKKANQKNHNPKNPGLPQDKLTDNHSIYLKEFF